MHGTRRLEALHWSRAIDRRTISTSRCLSLSLSLSLWRSGRPRRRIGNRSIDRCYESVVHLFGAKRWQRLFLVSLLFLFFCFFCFYGRRLIHRSVNGDAHFFADAAAVKRFGPVSRTRKNWATWNSNSIGWLHNDLHFATHNNDNNNNNKKQKTNAKRPVGSVALFFSTSHVTWGCLYLAATLNDVISR